jgi:hypothetical protein
MAIGEVGVVEGDQGQGWDGGGRRFGVSLIGAGHAGFGSPAKPLPTESRGKQADGPASMRSGSAAPRR